MTGAYFNLRTRPAGVVFRGLLAAALDYCSVFGFVIQEDRKHLSPRTFETVERLDTHLLSRTWVTEWPNSKAFFGYRVRQYLFELSPMLVEAVLDIEEDLYAWVNPGLPDDPHLLRSDGSAWFASTTIEEMSWFDLSSSELEKIRQDWPTFAADLEPID